MNRKMWIAQRVTDGKWIGGLEIIMYSQDIFPKGETNTTLNFHEEIHHESITNIQIGYMCDVPDEKENEK